MGPEIWVGITAVFVSGGAIGAAGTLLAQWIVRKASEAGQPPRSLDKREVALLRAEVSDMSRQLRNLDSRVDFQEELLGGSLQGTAPPPRLAPPDTEPEPADPDVGDS
jgi:hypothetical protein